MDKKSGKPSQKRRAILQGSLAAPVVLTVSSPSAAAVTTFGRCLANQVNAQPAKSLYFTESPDNWFRQSVPVVQLKYQGVEDWYYLDPSISRYVKLSSKEQMSFGTLLPSGWTQKDASTRRILVWVEPTSGTPSRFLQVEQPGGYTAATMSCMTSVRPAG
ncbi:MAG TPA: hypothetical protein VFN64_11385 [Burkholderiaceae bacterium]|nr:hypothetical protein [Burkholderiaceae bacterium]